MALEKASFAAKRIAKADGGKALEEQIFISPDVKTRSTNLLHPFHIYKINTCAENHY
jgi:hypothetical protein